MCQSELLIGYTERVLDSTEWGCGIEVFGDKSDLRKSVERLTVWVRPISRYIIVKTRG